MDEVEIIRYAQSLDRSADSAERLYEFLLGEFSLARPSEAPMERRGKFITFDGHSGAGKDTQMGMLMDYMRSDGFYGNFNIVPLVQKREDPFRQIPKFLWAHPELQAGDYCSFLLLNAGRRYHVHSKVLPQLEDHKNILMQNRSYLSHVAYHANDACQLPDLLAFCSFDPAADLPFVLGCNTDTAFERVERRSPEKGGVIYRNETPEYIARVKANFEAMAGLVDGLMPVDTSGTPEEAAQCIRGHVDRLFGRVS